MHFYNVDGAVCKRLNLQLEEGVSLIEYGYEDFKDRESITKNRKISTHVIQFVARGNGQYYIDDNIYDLNKNTLFYLPPNTPLKYQKSLSDPYKYFWISLFGKNVQKTLRYFNISKSNPVMHFKDDELLSLFSKFNSANMSAYELKGLCYSIFACLQKNAHGNDYSPDISQGIADKLKDYVYTNYNNPSLSVSDICKELNLSSIQLFRLSKTVFGTSTKKMLLNCRMEQAEKLLKQGYSVNFVATVSGFSDIYYFSKEFKKIHGIPPSKFK